MLETSTEVSSVLHSVGSVLRRADGMLWIYALQLWSCRWWSPLVLNALAGLHFRSIWS